jgi:hypothetical protein
MRFLLRRILTVPLLGVALGLIACSSSSQATALNERPSCVNLSAYSHAIEQIMGISPVWTPLQPTNDGFESAGVRAA